MKGDWLLISFWEDFFFLGPIGDEKKMMMEVILNLIKIKN